MRCSRRKSALVAPQQLALVQVKLTFRLDLKRPSRGRSLGSCACRRVGQAQQQAQML